MSEGGFWRPDELDRGWPHQGARAGRRTVVPPGASQGGERRAMIKGLLLGTALAAGAAVAVPALLAATDRAPHNAAPTKVAAQMQAAKSEAAVPAKTDAAPAPPAKVEPPAASDAGVPTPQGDPAAGVQAGIRAAASGAAPCGRQAWPNLDRECLKPSGGELAGSQPGPVRNVTPRLDPSAPGRAERKPVLAGERDPSAAAPDAKNDVNINEHPRAESQPPSGDQDRSASAPDVKNADRARAERKPPDEREASDRQDQSRAGRRAERKTARHERPLRTRPPRTSQDERYAVRAPRERVGGDADDATVVRRPARAPSDDTVVWRGRRGGGDDEPPVVHSAPFGLDALFGRPPRERETVIRVLPGEREYRVRREDRDGW